MKTISLLVAGSFIAASVIGCKDKSSPEAPPAATSTASVTASAAPSGSGLRRGPMLDRRGQHGMRRGGEFGMSGMLFRAAHDLELREGQKVAVDDIQKSMHGEDAGAPGAEFREMQALIAAGIRAGKLDTDKLTAMQAELDKGMQAKRDKDTAALQRLHDALDPAQRKALVASVRARQGEREAKFAALAPDAGPPKGDEFKKRRVEKLAKELDLDADQQKKVEGLMAKPAPKGPAAENGREGMKKRMEALLTAFEADAFDAKKLDEGTPARKMAEGMSEHLQFLNGLLAILKPEQREKMAANMEKGSQRRSGRWDPRDPGYGVLMFDDEGPDDDLGPERGPRLEGPGGQQPPPPPAPPPQK